MVKLKNLSVYIVFMIGLIMAGFPIQASAHASLSKATPAPDTELKQAPEKIVLTFNERLENSQFYIKLFDAKGNQVDTEAATLSDDHQTVSLSLPALRDGTYIVEYYVISADGHPVDDRYGFSLFQSAEEPSDETTPVNPGNSLNQNDPDKEINPPEDSIDEDAQSYELDDTGHEHGGFLLWTLQTGYYFLLLLFTGWVFWGRTTDISSYEESYINWFRKLRLIMFIVIAFYGLARLLTLLSEFSWSSLIDLLLHTTVGIAWIGLFLLSALSFILLKRAKWVDFAWILLLFSAEAFYGHAAAYQPLWYSISFDVIHLIAASIWVSGLVMLFLIKRVQGSFLTPFTHQFSKYAFISIVFLFVSGSLLALRYLPDLSSLMTTTWGLVLVLKLVLVIIVVVLGSMLRKTLDQVDDHGFSKKIEWDLAVMLAILFVVAMLTSFNPASLEGIWGG